MSYQSEAQLENQLIEDLVAHGYFRQTDSNEVYNGTARRCCKINL